MVNCVQTIVCVGKKNLVSASALEKGSKKKEQRRGREIGREGGLEKERNRDGKR